MYYISFYYFMPQLSPFNVRYKGKTSSELSSDLVWVPGSGGSLVLKAVEEISGDINPRCVLIHAPIRPHHRKNFTIVVENAGNRVGRVDSPGHCSCRFQLCHRLVLCA